MKVVQFNQVDRKEWNDLCDRSSQAWLMHRWEWIDIESRYFFPENYSFAVIQGQRLVAVQPLYLFHAGLGTWIEILLHSGLHRHTGLALADNLESGMKKEARSVAMAQIDQIALDVDADRIQLNSQNLAPANLGFDRREIPFWVSDLGYYLGLNMGPGGLVPAPGLATCCADQIVYLADSEEVLFSRLDESCRRAVRKAKAANLQVCEGMDGSINDYYSLAKLSAVRTGETLAPLGYYEGVWDAMYLAGNCQILFVTHAERKVAALLLLTYKGGAHFLGGVSDPEFLSMRVNDFLHWSAILWAKRRGLKVYRLGPIFPELPDDWPVARVSRFKGKFGGRSVPIIQGSRFRYPEKYLEAAKAHISALVAVKVKAK